MIIILATVNVQPGRADEALRLSLEHVRRSRAEPGCISHNIHRDHEDPDRLVFVERWADRAAVDAHFAVPDARAFSRTLGSMSDGRTDLQVYEAELLA